MPKRKKDESASSNDSDNVDWVEDDDPPVKGAYMISCVWFIYICDHHITCCCILSYQCVWVRVRYVHDPDRLLNQMIQLDLDRA